MATYYDVLGVAPSAAPDVVRRAYLDLARRLHPDRSVGLSPADQQATARRMQQVNEAWRVLRDPKSRAAYDRSLAGAGRRPGAPKGPPRHAAAPRTPRPPRPEADDDTPIAHTPAEPGDVGVSIARAVPWIAVAVVLLAIFIFTAFAGPKRGADSQSLVGRCISLGTASAVVAVPCEGPNDGKVVAVVGSEATCPSSSKAHPLDAGRSVCVEPEQPKPTYTPVTPVSTTSR